MTTLLVIGTTAAAQVAPTNATALARESVALIGSLEMQLVAAVRQRDSRGGKADFQRFILDPVETMMDNWRAMPPAPDNAQRISCLAALQTFENHARDSFKAGAIAQPPQLLAETRASCSKMAGAKPKR